MRILFINNDGGGFADYLDVAPGTTVQQLFKEKLPYGKPGDYMIRVNRQPASSAQELVENDRVSITPLKIEGARMGPQAQAPLSPFPPQVEGPSCPLPVKNFWSGRRLPWRVAA